MKSNLLSQIRSCFDYKGFNHSKIDRIDNQISIIGNPYFDFKCAVIDIIEDKYDIYWNWTDKKFSQKGLTLAQLKKLIKFYQ